MVRPGLPTDDSSSPYPFFIFKKCLIYLKSNARMEVMKFISSFFPSKSNGSSAICYSLILLLFLTISCSSETKLTEVSSSPLWSKPMGLMSLEEGRSNCQKIGYRLPTPEELDELYNSSERPIGPGNDFWTSYSNGKGEYFTRNFEFGWVGYSRPDSLGDVICHRE